MGCGIVQVEDGRVMNWGWERGTAYGDAQVVDQTAEIASSHVKRGRIQTLASI